MSVLKMIGTVALAVGLTHTGTWAQAPTIPNPDVSGPAPEFDMGSRLMTSGKRMEVWLTIPGKGKVKVPKFNGTFKRIEIEYFFLPKWPHQAFCFFGSQARSGCHY